MDFRSNGLNEIHFVDGADSALSYLQQEAMTSASAHFLRCFELEHEVDVYVSKRSELQSLTSNTRAWHMPPSFDRDNSIVCVFVDPNSDLKQNITSLAHEMIHAWQVERGDLLGQGWKGMDLSEVPYQLQPWEIEAHGQMARVADYFFDDLIPSKSDLERIKETTDEVFQEIVKSAQSAAFKEKVAKVSKVAVALGLGALLGGV